jgi:hypothetical protein
MRRGALAALTVAASLGLAPAGAAAAGTPVDLGAILAPAPGSDYLEVPHGPVIDGPFNARVYAAYVTAVNGSDASKVVPTLERDGLKRGFGRSWLQLGTGYGLYERVFEFATAEGAGQWLIRQHVGNQALSEYRGPLAESPSIPGSWTAQLTKANGFRFFRVGFTKGNAEYEVTFGSGSTDNTSAALAQAQAQYARAPRYTIAPAAGPGLGIGQLGVAARIALVAVICVLLITVWVRRRPPPRR